MELIDWVPSNKLSTHVLQLNPNAIDHIEKYHIPKLWSLLSANPSAVRYLYHDPSIFNKGCWYTNPNPVVIPFIEQGKYKDELWVQQKLIENSNAFHLVNPMLLTKWNYRYLCKNTNPLAIQIIETLLDDLNDVDWDILSANPAAIHIIEKNMHRINWSSLSSNPSAIHILLKNTSRISWFCFSKNTHPLAIEYMKQNLDRVNWHILSANSAAIYILKENQDKLSWYWLSLNPSIFEYKYRSMAKKRTELIHDELISIALHPSRVCTWLQQGMTISDM